MAVPKRKTSKQRKHLRRNGAWNLGAPTLTPCPECKELKLPHRVCRACGKYQGRQVLPVKADA